MSIGQYLLFGAGGSLFGLELPEIKGVAPAGRIYPLPLMKENFEGVITHDEKVIPVFNLTGALGFKGGRMRADSFIVVEQFENEEIGLLIGDVKRVLQLDCERFTDYKGSIPAIKKKCPCLGRDALLVDVKSIINNA